MPPGHVAVTWGVARVIQKNNSGLTHLDYRLLALCGLLPDIIDKPLAILIFTSAESSQLVAHSLLFHAAFLLGALLFWRRAVPYVLAFNTHLVLDRMWHHTESFWWPLFGWNVFWQYKPMNSPEAMFNIYIDIITRYPQVWVFEIVAIIVLIGFGYRHRLYWWSALKRFLLTGRIEQPQAKEVTFDSSDQLTIFALSMRRSRWNTDDAD